MMLYLRIFHPVHYLVHTQQRDLGHGTPLEQYMHLQSRAVGQAIADHVVVGMMVYSTMGIVAWIVIMR